VAVSPGCFAADAGGDIHGQSVAVAQATGQNQGARVCADWIALNVQVTPTLAVIPHRPEVDKLRTPQNAYTGRPGKPRRASAVCNVQAWNDGRRRGGNPCFVT
jgi:hypothetical protein